MREFRDPSSGLANIVKFLAFKKLPANASLFFDEPNRSRVQQALAREARGETTVTKDAPVQKSTKPRGTGEQKTTLLSPSASAGQEVRRRSLLGVS